jgi:uncharacterized protein
MIGTIINVATILIGGTIGVLLGGKLPEKLRHSVISIMGLFTIGLGLQMFLKTQNSLIVLVSLMLGAICGEWLKIEDALGRLGSWLEQKTQKNGDQSGERDRFIRGFLVASLVFCVGPMAILGSIQDGLTGDHTTLVIKAVLDGFGAMAFASTLGVGVVFSALPILIYQGTISLLATQVQAVMTQPMITEMTAAGGVILMAVAISSLLEIKQLRPGNYVPALLFAPLIVALLTLLGIKI